MGTVRTCVLLFLFWTVCETVSSPVNYRWIGKRYIEELSTGRKYHVQQQKNGNWMAYDEDRPGAPNTADKWIDAYDLMLMLNKRKKDEEKQKKKLKYGASSSKLNLNKPKLKKDIKMDMHAVTAKNVHAQKTVDKKISNKKKIDAAKSEHHFKLNGVRAGGEITFALMDYSKSKRLEFRHKTVANAWKAKVDKRMTKFGMSLAEAERVSCIDFNVQELFGKIYHSVSRLGLNDHPSSPLYNEKRKPNAPPGLVAQCRYQFHITNNFRKTLTPLLEHTNWYQDYLKGQVRSYHKDRGERGECDIKYHTHGFMDYASCGLCALEEHVMRVNNKDKKKQKEVLRQLQQTRNAYLKYGECLDSITCDTFPQLDARNNFIPGAAKNCRLSGDPLTCSIDPMSKMHSVFKSDKTVSEGHRFCKRLSNYDILFEEVEKFLSDAEYDSEKNTCKSPHYMNLESVNGVNIKIDTDATALSFDFSGGFSDDDGEVENTGFMLSTSNMDFDPDKGNIEVVWDCTEKGFAHELCQKTKDPDTCHDATADYTVDVLDEEKALLASCRSHINGVDFKVLCKNAAEPPRRRRLLQNDGEHEVAHGES